MAMQCNVRMVGGNKKVPCYKTKYKNIVVTKIDGYYTITHYPTGMSLTGTTYARKKDAVQNIPEAIKRVKKQIPNIKQLCEQRQIYRIN